MEIEKHLQKLGIKTIPGTFYNYIEEWLEWYQGEVEKFHKYNVYNGIQMVGQKRATLGMAKRVCEDWAALLMNEKVEFTTQNEDATKRVHEIMHDNNFRVKASQLVELTFALGTGAFVEYMDNKKIKIDYIRANMIFPISWDNTGITECAFASEKTIAGKKCVYIQVHRLKNGKYVIQNRLFNSETGAEEDLPATVKADYDTKSTKPFFQIITPCIVNNVDLDIPLGISVYANALDVLKGADIVYDSYCNEFKLGKKRVYVPVSMAKVKMAQDGTAAPIFDNNDTVFYALQSDEANELKESDMKLRAVEHSEGLRENLNLLSEQCGFGKGRYRFEKGGVKTATEVISEDSDLYKNLKKHEHIFENALINLIQVLLFLDGRTTHGEIKIDFDDSIIHDTDAEFAKNLQLVSSGIMTKVQFRQWWFNESEAEAKKNLPSDPYDGAGDE